ncbi:MAG: type III polyketide synthase [Candidatus Dormiibacterota bacterium]
MTRLLGFGSAFPEYELSPEASRRALSRVWPHLGAVKGEPVTRRLALPIEQVLTPRSLEEDMAVYRREAGRLAAEAARAALESSGVAASEVDCLIAVSCTGYLVPGLDVIVRRQMGLAPDVLRVSLTEHGCSGGGAALGLAHRLCAGHQVAIALVVCVELCSLTFRAGDDSLDNLAASLVFGDGAAAAVVADRPGGLQMVRVGSVVIPGTEGILGFDLRDDGFHPVLDRHLPGLLARELPLALAEFGVGPGSFQAVHAGGPRIFDAVEAALGLTQGELRTSRDVYRRHGNLSSASLLLVLSALPSVPGDGLALAFGPGVAVEMLQLRRLPE